MSASTEKASQDLATLKSTVATATALISQLQTTSAAIDSGEQIDKHSNVNALHLAHDTASLIRAHSTQLSLLIINKPFTPTAINTVLRELVAGPLPGLASAIEICNAAKYTKVMSEELRWRGNKVFVELGTLVEAVPLDGQLLSEDQKNGTGATNGKGSLASTGVLWEACDAVIALKSIGISGLVIKKAEQYRDLLKDALDELREWGEEESDDEAEEDEDEGDHSDTDAAQDAIDKLFASERHIPREDTEKVRPRLESSKKRLQLVITMYSAVVKRRLKTLPALPHPPLPEELRSKSSGDPGIVSCLDELLNVMKKIPDITDELANAFYELNVAEIDKRMDECFFNGFAAAELLVLDWEGQKDEFTSWASKFQIAMKKGW